MEFLAIKIGIAIIAFLLSPQSSFFAELREVVRCEDSLRFDELIFQPSSILHRRLISETEEEDDDEGQAAGGASTAGGEVRKKA